MYEHTVYKSNELADSDNLDVMAADGWRLITIVQHEGNFYYYFDRLKRPS